MQRTEDYGPRGLSFLGLITPAGWRLKLHGTRHVTPRGLTACVWDLCPIWFERQAWVETVLANPAGPDLDACLARRMSGEV